MAISTIDSTGLAPDGAWAPSGTVLQVVYAQTNGNLGSTTSTSYVEITSNLRVTITPLFASSKLLIIYAGGTAYGSGIGNPWGATTIFRDGSDVLSGSTYAIGYTQAVGTQSGQIVSGSFFVDANNTNATTFSPYVRAGSGYTYLLDASRRCLTVMEIAG